MEKIFTLIVQMLSDGGPGAVIVLLFSLIVYLGWDRTLLIKTVKAESETHHKDLMEVIDKYQKGQIDMIHALNEIKLILVKLEAKS